MGESPLSPSILRSLHTYDPPSKPQIKHAAVVSSSEDEMSPVVNARRANPVLVISDDSDSDGPSQRKSKSDEDCIFVSSSSNVESVNTPVKNIQRFSRIVVSEDEADENDNGFNADSSNHKLTTENKEEKKELAKRKKKMSNKNKKRRERYDESDSDEMDENMFKRSRVYDSDDDDDESGKIMKSKRTEIVKLLDNGTEKELYSIPNMTKKKLDIILAARPFHNWTNTVRTFKETKGLACSMFNPICESLVAKEVVLDLMSKCEEQALETEHIICRNRTLVSEQPSSLNPELKLSGYQLVGLNWLVLMRSRSLNSILADEMGLGKTIQVIAFLAYLKENSLVMEGYPHLIVVPSSTLNNWYDEFRRWCPSLNVTKYQGNQFERRYMRHVWFKDGFGDIDVILTTYSCAVSTPEEKKMFRIKEFNYIVFDEAHMLKNMNTQRYDALMQFNGNFKILLTGTPLQNNLLELMSLLIFLMPDLFKSKVQYIKLLFSKCSKNVDEACSLFEKEKAAQAKRIIEPFMLRRLKENVLRDLPPKTMTVEKCPLPHEQAQQYRDLVEEFKASRDDVTDTNSHMMYFMLLRKMANHPLLLRYIYTEDKLEKMAEQLAADIRYKGSNAEHIKEDLYFKSDFELHSMCQEYKCLQKLNYELTDEEFCNSGKFQKLTPLLISLKESGHRVLIFSQFITMLDIFQEYCRIMDFTYLRLDGSTMTNERQELIDLYNADESIFIFLLSTKAGGLGINLTAADTVIINDVDYNPYNDKQAEDRCHRVGQTKPVTVIRLISENTVEETINDTAMAKLHLEKEITANDTDKNSETKTVAQLLYENLGITDSV